LIGAQNETLSMAPLAVYHSPLAFEGAAPANIPAAHYPLY